MGRPISFFIIALVLSGCKNPLGGDNEKLSKIDDVFLNQGVNALNSSTTIRKNSTEIITLSYSSKSTTVSSCEVSEELNLTVVSPCICSSDVCTVTVQGHNNFVGTAGFEFNITDSLNIKSSNAHVEVNITAFNSPPTLTQMSDLSTNSGVLVSGNISALDTDNNLSCSNLSATSLYQSLVLDSNISITGVYPNCLINITPEANQRGSNVITVTLNDGDAIDPKIDAKTFEVLIYNPPSTPQNLELSIVSNQINLNWTSPNTGTAPFTYNISRGTVSGFYTLLSTTSSTSFIDSTAVAGIEYFYVISATNTDGSSNQSNEVSGRLLGSFSVTNPSSTAQTTNTGDANIEWSASVGASSYDIYYKTTSNGSYILYGNTTNLSMNLPSLPAGLTYYIKVRAKNNSSHLDSNEVSVYIKSLFNLSFDFNNSLDYVVDVDAEISATGRGRLVASNLITEKTSNGTASSNNQPFNNYISKDDNLALVSDKIQMISGTTAEYVSQALDRKNSLNNLTYFSFQTSKPFGKELSLTPETGYQSAVTDFSTGLVALWRFNELSNYNGTANEFKDAIGTNNGRLISGVVSSASTGIFNRAASFSSTGSNLLQSPDNSSLDGTNKLTISTWVYPTTLDGNPRAILSKRNNVGSEASYSLFFFAGNRLAIDIDSHGDRFSSNKVFTTNKWYHIVVVYNGTNPSASRVSLYIDGVLDKTSSESSASLPNYNSPIYFGSMNGSYGYNYGGLIDETAIWKNRALTTTEVSELNQRGSNRIKFQVRTCTSTSGGDCAGTISPWIGKDATDSTLFTEQNNSSDPINLLGAVSSGVYNQLFSAFGSNMNSWLGIHGSAQYVQYRTVFESDSSSNFPDLYKVSFQPDSQYAVSSSIRTLSSISFLNINAISLTQSCGDANSNNLDDDIRYSLSFDGGLTYLFWNGTSWINSSSFATSNTKEVLESLTTTQFNLAQGSTGSLLLRVYLTSSGSTACEVDNIAVSGIQ